MSNWNSYEIYIWRGSLLCIKGKGLLWLQMPSKCHKWNESKVCIWNIHLTSKNFSKRLPELYLLKLCCFLVQMIVINAMTVNRTPGLKIFSLTLSQLSYHSCVTLNSTCPTHRPAFTRPNYTCSPLLTLCSSVETRSTYA